MKLLIAFVFFLQYSCGIFAQQVKEPQLNHPEWSQSYPPFRIAGNLYYVGTYDLACYLITTKKGNILINTGLAASADQIKENIAALGFKVADVKILLTTQAHFDHLGAMAAIKKETGAKMMIDEADASVLQDGGQSDYELGGPSPMFTPLQPDRLLKDGDVVRLGNMRLKLLHHPGHTKGSCSFQLTVKDSARSYNVLIANMPTIITDKSFDSVAAYSGIAADYAYTLQAMKQLQFDIWLASHASQFGLHKKHATGDAYNPMAFADRAGYDAALADLQQDYDDKMKRR